MGIMKNKEKILKWQQKAYDYAVKSDNYAQKIARECQKYCDFEIKFVQNNPGDGLVLVYDNEEFSNVHCPVDYFIKLYERTQRKITLDDVAYIGKET